MDLDCLWNHRILLCDIGRFGDKWVVVRETDGIVWYAFAPIRMHRLERPMLIIIIVVL